MYILGISAFYHDSSACLIQDGHILAACQEERFTRIKHDSSFPTHSIRYCLKYADITPDQISYIVFYDKPFLKFDRLIETYFAFAPRGFKSFISSFPSWIKDKLFQKRSILNSLSDLLDENIDWNRRLLFSNHHLSHASSAFFPSPFESAAILTMDGVGEWTTTSISIGYKNSINTLKEIHFPHSLGLLYSAITYYAGFKVNSGEYKVMGLAPYGSPSFLNLMKDNLINIKDDGSFCLNMEYFDFCTDLKMTSKKFNTLFGAPPRNPESEITQREMDLAASIQYLTEEILIKMARHIAIETGQKNLCLAGGVALNCVANGKLLRENIFENIWIQPAAGDAGGSLGAALATHYIMLGKPRDITEPKDSMQGSFLGPSFDQHEVLDELIKLDAVFDVLTNDELIDVAAQSLADGKALGWMNGRMEFGPRSLGARSILADPRSPKMQKLLNLKVKYRESFRPFAPSILREDVSDWFDLNKDSPYMLFVANVALNKRREMTSAEDKLFGIDKLNVIRSDIPSVTHVDYSARIQTVHPDTNPAFYKLIEKFKEITGFPIVVNTSFNVRGEPIVCSPTDAFKCFMGTELDLLIVGNVLLRKDNQTTSKRHQHKDQYALD